MASAEGTRIEALSRIGSGEGCPIPSRLGGLGERCELPQWGPGRSTGRKRILDIFLAHRTRLVIRKSAEMLKNLL